VLEYGRDLIGSLRFSLSLPGILSGINLHEIFLFFSHLLLLHLVMHLEELILIGIPPLKLLLPLLL
jgi:hypothetical protein